MIDIGYAGAFLGGVLTLLSPCSAVLLPAFFAYAFSTATTLVGRTGVFYLGLLTTLVPLGVAASVVGALFTVHRATTVAVLSCLVILLGVLQLLGVRVPGLPRPRASTRSRRDGSSTSVLAVYLLGAGFGLAGVCSGPILGSVLTVAAMGSDPLYGGVLLAVYGLGMVVPVLLLAGLRDRYDLGHRAWLKPRGVSIGPVHTSTTAIASGFLFIGIGVLMLTTEGTANLGGILSIDTQYRAEAGVQSWADRVPDLVVIAVIAAAGLLTVLWSSRRRRTERPQQQAPTIPADTR